jgi:hypothetical protein
MIASRFSIMRAGGINACAGEFIVYPRIREAVRQIREAVHDAKACGGASRTRAGRRPRA